MNDNYAAMISLRLNQEQAETIRRWAIQHDMSLSDVIRYAIEAMTGAKA